MSAREIWRLLDTGTEDPENGDQYYSYSNWWEFNESGNCAIDSDRARRGNLIVRRRETIEDEPKWEEVRDRTSMRVWAIPTISRHEDGSFHFLMAGAIQSHLATHYLKLPMFPQENVDFETFWQANKEKLIDVSKDAARLIYEKARQHAKS